ncbi:hypothetical protein N7508_004228 [Penicillium antarcticum]|uniref:uncharacterized protein n=1 Tax=Penicillium antarcticum TaxID=416450 RepID=UPI0023930CEA|nr:uncharacterized protein N7508_004228 [Penicillium antarcticum]KAJ5308849.1 hypothetical protein N7508_004228 [Penicillium antarcticum]
MATKSKEKRPGRITIACNVCRSRKQKCLEYNRPCNWPEQLRRYFLGDNELQTDLMQNTEVRRKDIQKHWKTDFSSQKVYCSIFSRMFQTSNLPRHFLPERAAKIAARPMCHFQDSKREE